MAEKRWIEIDDRVGSKELHQPLTRLSLPARLARLRYGDAAFTGKGPHGEVKVGVERKTIQDLLNSIASGRLAAHQLPGLVQEYDRRWLVVEGLWRAGRDYSIEVWKGGGWRPAVTRMGYAEVERFLISMEVNGGCWVRRTGSLWETVMLVSSLWRWWGKDWGEHKAHLAMEKGLTPDRVLYSTPSYPRLVANVLPGIGWKKSRAVARRFKTIERMVNARPDEWMQVAGVGKKLGDLLPKILAGDRTVSRAREG